ncbi:Chromatin structure remodeling complex protein sfh1 [Paramarasmius palmivorus]|uniref:Chromatin structure remodeling complex protein sfh1 n=1 Tax=Paramarasmius palmivorus TaxID=297713 RepID=A0AAW0BP24_9AGAR
MSEQNHNGFRDLTDLQLKNTIAQLQANAGGFHPSVPHQGNSATYQKNLQAWSSTPTPPPRTASAGIRPSRARAGRPSNLTSTPTPAPVPVATPYRSLPQPQAVPVAASQPVQNAASRLVVPATSQALRTTYSSRLRTGATLLMQPIITTGSTSNAPSTSAATAVATTTVAATTAALGTRSSGRRTGVVNYADPGSGDEFPDAGAIDSDDSDFVASGGTRTSIRQGKGGAGAKGTGAFRLQGSAGAGEEALDQSYLGMVPPDKFIKARYMPMTAHVDEESLFQQSRRPSALVPIRVEFDTETHRIRDCFVWNLYEETIKPEVFARIFCNDLDLPVEPWAETVANQIKAQLEDCEGIARMELGMDSAVGFETQKEDVVLQDDDESMMQVDERQGTESRADEIPECRVMLSIDVQIATHHLLDHIEWDLLSPLTPEAFATTLCAELGLSGEAIPLVAHAIHEELIKHKKDVVDWGVISSASATMESGLTKDKTGLGRVRGPKPLKSVWRDWAEAEEFRTRFEVMTQEEVERREMERERAARRLRRETSKFQSLAGGAGRSRRR